MSKKLQTIKTYNDSADLFAEKFDELGARIEDIEEVFKLVNKDNPRVLEIGCGNGRDAREIIKFTDDYLGVDILEKFIKLAREKVPSGRFEVADIENFNFPGGLDVIFAFASLIHLPKEILKKIFSNAFVALNNGGIFRLSMKYSDVYSEKTETDKLGPRTFYLYSQEDITRLIGPFSVLSMEVHDFSGQKWLEVILKKL